MKVYGRSVAQVHPDLDSVFLVTTGRLVVHLPFNTIARRWIHSRWFLAESSNCSVAETETQLVLIESCSP